MTRAEAVAAKRAHRAAQGLCTECDTPRLPGHSLCQRHFEMRRQRLKDWNRRRKTAGRCFCGKPVKRGRDRCPECLAIETRRVLDRYIERKAAGLCMICGKAPPRRGKVICRNCARRQATSYLHRKERRLRVAHAKLRRGQLFRLLMPEG